ncbi:unnamed protein product, partial [Ectocarpus sp. 13 AM-2016]
MALADRDALVALFRSTGGASWGRKDRWDTSAELATWCGVEVNDEGRVVRLSLGSNNLEGHIPPQLGKLGALEGLHLSWNKLDGHIPKELGALSKLETLWLNGNKLAGSIPPELGSLRKLSILDLASNNLSGPIPKELGGLTELEGFNLSCNQLSALWDHTRGVQDVGQEAARTMSGGHIPSELRRLLDTLDRAERAYLDLGSNPWAEPPESIVANGMKSVRGYFEDLYAEPCRVQRSSIKIVLVGQEGAGKTSLRKSMKANEATLTGETKEESTVFADVEPMEIEGSSV